MIEKTLKLKLSATMPSAYLLVCHGSRDPRPQVAMDQLAELVAQVESSERRKPLRRFSAATGQLASMAYQPLVGTACLELSLKPLHEQIKEFGDRALACGCNSIQLVPLFLLPGVHVMEDIPAQVAIAQQMGQELKINLRPYLGTHPGLSSLLAAQVAAMHSDAWILLAHGSRRAGSKQPIEAMAKHLGAVTAYWSVPPKLETRVKELVSAGHRRIGILPYFLFAGGITDAIAQSVEQLKLDPDTVLQLAEPIGASAKLADLIVDLIEG